MHVLAIVTVLAAMFNPLPAADVDAYNVNFAKQFEQPVIEAVYVFNN